MKETVSSVFRQLKDITEYFFPFFVLFLALLGIFTASFLPWKIDVSRGRVYSLSNSTKQILKQLKRPVKITIYASINPPAQLTPIYRDLFDMLDEYRRYGGIKINIDRVDTSTSAGGQKALAEGMQQVRFSRIANNELSVSGQYLGAVVSLKNKKEKLPLLLDPGQYEYELTSAIYRISQRSLPVVGFIQPQDHISRMIQSRNFIEKQFDYKEVNFDNINSFVLDGVVYFVDASQTIDSKSVKKLNSLIVKGMPVFIFVDGVNVSDNLQVRSSISGINKFIKRYGITVERNLLLSQNSEIATFNTGAASFSIQYPYWLKTGPDNIKLSKSISSVGSLIFPWSSSLRIDEKKAKSIVVAPNGTWEERNNFELLPTGQIKPKQSKLVFTIAAATKSKKNHLIVFATTRFLNDQFISPTTSNLPFFTYLVDEYLSQGKLSGIGVRSVEFIPISNNSKNVQKIVQYGSIALSLVILIAIGVISLRKRIIIVD